MGKSQNIQVIKMRKTSILLLKHSAYLGLFFAFDEEECEEGVCKGNNQITPNED